MEHEVFVPVPVPALRRTLGDPARVGRCVPGFQQDAGASASPLAGRLKFRAGSHTITYRGELRITGPGGPDASGGQGFSVTGEGVAARGAGEVKLALTIGLTAADGGTTLAYSGTASGDGRLAELEEGAALAAAHRFLDRFTQQLVTEALAAHDDDPAGRPDETPGRREESAGPEGEPPGRRDAAVGADAEGAGAEGLADDVEGAAAEEAGGEEGGGEESDGGDPGGRDSGPVFDSPAPPPALDPVAGVEFTVPDEPPAEAAHARRTMIGRSAEEVDHAPPRGRYAPVPSPDSAGAGATLRWVAPAAALALASAVVLGRVLRRRR
ncbi:hypothetical protein EES43_13065 [Streptomyces sp. ADI96-02]|uniref:CoxG family protein n=1 Tax=Streptomyces sp. ADI96-02 TaxID=1522760 RepID=UPI000F55068B|nr:carbon monoxide dehydrogenase [Streptomyces sp. ADI96-02]RPK62751.1 hypothetical protein EES43_13065 [Streptomyces sp. ADI96-02]